MKTQTRKSKESYRTKSSPTSFSGDEFSSFREQEHKKEHFQLKVLFVSEKKEQSGRF